MNYSFTKINNKDKLDLFLCSVDLENTIKNIDQFPIYIDGDFAVFTFVQPEVYKEYEVDWMQEITGYILKSDYKSIYKYIARLKGEKEQWKN